MPIRQQRWWPGLPDNKPESMHLLGYNEPNNPVEDAYQTGLGTPEAAVGAWPGLLGNGLRIGSPAPADGGRGWLHE